MRRCDTIRGERGRRAARPRGLGALALEAVLWVAAVAALGSGAPPALAQGGVPVEVINKLSQPSYNIADALREGRINIIVNTPTHGRIPQRDGFKLRRLAVESKLQLYILKVPLSPADPVDLGQPGWLQQIELWQI